MLVDSVPDSPILSLIEQVFRLRAAGHPVLSLHIGEPDFETPVGIREAASRAMREGLTHYVAAQGMPDLRAAIADRESARHHVPAGPDDVVVLPAKFGIYASVLATAAPGDDVLLPDPTYLFDAPIRLAGARPISFPLRADFSLDPAALDAAVTPRSKLLFLVTPANPTGRTLRRDELRAVLGIARDRGLTVVSDETYASLVYEGSHLATASVGDGTVPIVTLGSFSKAFAMTGWRAGYAIAPSPIRERLVKVVEHTLTCVPPFVQRACLWALQHADGDTTRFREKFRERRDHLLNRMDDLPGLRCVRPEGAFYLFPSYDLKMPSREFAARLLDEERLAIVPGVAFGSRGEGHVRISYTSPIDVLDEGMERLGRFLESHGARRG